MLAFTLLPLISIFSPTLSNLNPKPINSLNSAFVQPIVYHNRKGVARVSNYPNSQDEEDEDKEYWLNGSRIPGSIQPINDYVLVEQPISSGPTTGGVILSGRKQRISGKVIAVGEGAVSSSGMLVPIGIKAGDIVMHSQANSDQVIKYNGKECVLVKATDVYCKIETGQYGYLNEGISESEINPLGSRILIKVLSQPGVTESGLVLTKSDNGLARGVVLRIGPGDYNSNGVLIPVTGLEVGQQVLYSEDVAKPSLFALNRDTFALIPVKDIQAKI